MGGKKDLTSKDSVAKSQKVYDRITSGNAKNVTAELNKTHKGGQ